MSGSLALAAASTLLADIQDQPGAVLFSGIDTLAPGALYVMGFNPGGSAEGLHEDGSGSPTTIGESLLVRHENWNDWADGQYGSGGQYSVLQTRIRSVFELLGADPRRTFSTNALFTRSSVSESVAGAWELWWRYCWPVHQVFLATVRPRVVVCLGNGGKKSTWELLRLTEPQPEGQSRYRPNWTDVESETSLTAKWKPIVTFDLGNGTSHSCAVLGLPHPSQRMSSHWPLSSEAVMKVALTRARMVNWERQGSDAHAEV